MGPALIFLKPFEQGRRQVAFGEGRNDQHDVLAGGFRRSQEEALITAYQLLEV